MIKKIATFVAVLACAAWAHAGVATTITQWNFNGASATTVPGGGTSPSPSTGVGTASLIGGTSGSFASGTSDGGSSDPVTTTPPNYAWSTTTWPAQGNASGTAGVQFMVSTAGYSDIVVWWDSRSSATASRFVHFEYTADGGATWVPAGTFESTSTAFHFWGNDLTGELAVENNPNFGFRLVTVFAPGTSAYAPINTGSTYGTGGTIRWDMVEVRGVVPEPGSLAMLGIGCIGLLARRRRS